MLPDEVKETVQSAYRQIVERRNLTPRYGQRLMIAEIARALSDVNEADTGQEQSSPSPVCVVEAGTGTGKTLAYVLGALPLAQHLDKKLVIATATVALQEQIIHHDLPDILAHTDLDFRYTLAKGRGRYVCLSRLDQLLQGNESQEAMEELFGESLDQDRTAENRELYEEMLNRISSGHWRGDRDEWDSVLSEAQWRPLTVEAGQCAGQKCSHYQQCCFYRAREEVRKVDCVVANQDLVLVDLALGGGAILPDPADTIYIFDEAHHLPAKTNQHFASVTRLRGSLQWLENCGRMLKRLQADPALDSDSGAGRSGDMSEQLRALSEDLAAVIPPLEQLGERLQPGDRDQARHTFELGVVPEPIREQAAGLARGFSRLHACLRDLASELKRDMEGAGSLEACRQAEHWFPLVGGMASRAEASQKLWHHFSVEDPAGAAPWARWLSVVEQGGQIDLSLSCSPVLAAGTLQDKLWEQCAGAVLTSATLSALGSFDVLAMRAGLPGHTRYHRIASPFDYANRARFVVPRLGCEPGDGDAHTQAIVEQLPRVLDHGEGALMLFSSRRQMLAVLEGLDREWRDTVLCQDDYQKAQLLRFHRERVDREETSVIFGLASFAEGVDLPGRYCEHVLIAKLPFAVPDDPIEGTLAQWLEHQGRNPFMTLAVPEAALRLVQASGRLLRSETDRGRITLFDERIVNRRYGRAILDSLPPFTREIFPEAPASVESRAS